MVVCDIETWDGMVTQRGTDFKLSVAARFSRSLEIVKPLGLGSLCAGLVKFSRDGFVFVKFVHIHLQSTIPPPSARWVQTHGEDVPN